MTLENKMDGMLSVSFVLSLLAVPLLSGNDTISIASDHIATSLIMMALCFVGIRILVRGVRRDIIMRGTAVVILCFGAWTATQVSDYLFLITRKHFLIREYRSDFNSIVSDLEKLRDCAEVDAGPIDLECARRSDVLRNMGKPMRKIIVSQCINNARSNTFVALFYGTRARMWGIGSSAEMCTGDSIEHFRRTQVSTNIWLFVGAD
jgi:hypothetical protein